MEGWIRDPYSVSDHVDEAVVKVAGDGRMQELHDEKYG